MIGSAWSSDKGPLSAAPSTYSILHDQVVGAYIVKRADVGVIQRRNRTRFARKTFRELLFGNLNSDIAIQAGVVRAVYLAHAAHPDERQDLVGPEFVALNKRHKCLTILPRITRSGARFKDAASARGVRTG